MSLDLKVWPYTSNVMSPQMGEHKKRRTGVIGLE